MVSVYGGEMEASVEKHLLLTIPCENGELYSTLENNSNMKRAYKALKEAASFLK